MHARVCNSYVNPDDLEIVPVRDYARDTTEVTTLKRTYYTRDDISH